MDMALRMAVKAGVEVPDVWYRFVDDVIARFRSDASAVERFLKYINGIRPSIRFTMEIESEGVLNFLDVAIDRRKGLSFGVYRKPTHTNNYLNRSSCHPRGVFRGVISSLTLRARRVCTKDTLGKELKEVETVLRLNGYGDKELELVRRIKDGEVRKEEGVRRWPIPYYPGLSERVARILKKVGKNLSLKPTRKICDMVVRKRFQEPLTLGCVYNICCSDCDFTYVGETGRTVEERVSEHRRAVKNFEERSELAMHVAETGHGVDWAGVSVIDRERDYFKRGFKEAWWTSVFRGGNRTRCVVSDVWRDFVR